MQTPPTPPTGLFDELRSRFDLGSDQATAESIDAAIRAGVVFRGTNLWLLIFAIVIASVGLNVNSTAVIIGAMLISPLMGPILGVGYGAAIADFALVRVSVLNLLIATVVSLIASAAYFFVTPLSEARSELLARTSPSLWDVLIALFGGLAGIVGVTRREKSNVLPGVAIATALMPPLCTAGYGVATGNLAYFAGAFYLFFINSVFIAAATFGVVRLMRLPEVRHLDALASRRAHRWIAVVVVATALPSLYLAQRLVVAEVFSARAGAFLATAFPADGETVVVRRDLDPIGRRLTVTVLGKEVTAAREEALASMLPSFGLNGVTLSIAQNERQTIDVAALREDLVRDLYQHSLQDLEGKEATIAGLRAELERASAGSTLLRSVEKEVAAQVPAARIVVSSSGGEPPSLTVVIQGAPELPAARRAEIEAWLKVRAAVQDVWLLQVDVPAPERPARPTRSR